MNEGKSVLFSLFILPSISVGLFLAAPTPTPPPPPPLCINLMKLLDVEADRPQSTACAGRPALTLACLGCLATLLNTAVETRAAEKEGAGVGPSPLLALLHPSFG